MPDTKVGPEFFTIVLISDSAVKWWSWGIGVIGELLELGSLELLELGSGMSIDLFEQAGRSQAGFVMVVMVAGLPLSLSGAEQGHKPFLFEISICR